FLASLASWRFRFVFALPVLAVRGTLEMPIPRHPQIRLRLVTREALDRAQPRAIFTDQRRGFRLHSLIRARLHELANPQAAGIARGFARRQRVIGADHLVAERYIRLGSEEQSAIVGHAIQEIVRILR